MGTRHWHHARLRYGGLRRGRLGRTDRAHGPARSVELPGGTLFIEWREADDHILMTGPTEFEFEGELHFDGDGHLARVVRQS